MPSSSWFWPSSEEVNDFPDPVGFESEWKPWPADLEDGPSEYAEIFSREYIQNSWDNIQQNITNLQNEGRELPSRPAIKFQFLRLSGEQLTKFSAAFGLDEQVNRFATFSDDQLDDQRLGYSDFLRGDEKSLTVLICTEYGAEGMWGHWSTAGIASKKPSKMRFALIQTSSNKSGPASGGSWGHGKKAVAISSKFRTLAVYTCHDPRGGDFDKDGVTRRLMGVSYWRQHNLGPTEHRGLGVFGQLRQSQQGSWAGFSPLENDDADQIIEASGVPQLILRNPAQANERGTTYIVFEPTFSPEDLRSAIERNWWPLIRSHKLQIELLDFDGQELGIEPEKRTELAPFIHAYEVATGVKKMPDSQTKDLSFQGVKVGKLVVTVDASENGWSNDTATPGNTSIVALVRNDMVIAYQKSPASQLGRPPFIRGTLLVDRERNESASNLLKQAEPHLHNLWNVKEDMSTPAAAAALASKTLSTMHKVVLEFRKKFMQTDSPNDLHFDLFSKIFAGGDQKVRNVAPEIPPPPSVPRNYRINKIKVVNRVADLSDPRKLCFIAQAELSLSDFAISAGIQDLSSRVRLRWKVAEKNDNGVFDPDLIDDSNDKVPPIFTHSGDGEYTGIVTDVPQTFMWTSAAFLNDWKVMPELYVEEQ